MEKKFTLGVNLLSSLEGSGNPRVVCARLETRSRPSLVLDDRLAVAVGVLAISPPVAYPPLQCATHLREPNANGAPVLLPKQCEGKGVCLDLWQAAKCRASKPPL